MILRTCPSLIVGVAAVLLFQSAMGMAGTADAATVPPAARSADYQPTGEYYDWTKTRQPEQPWCHKYDQSLVYKVWNADKINDGKGCKVYVTYPETLEVIERIQRISLGVPQIVYLAGWQYNGHDSRYPAWDEANPHLKRPEDATALDSLRWLIREARQYNATVSLHINMFDAYMDSPLWQEYVDKDIIAKDKDGKPLPGMNWGGQTSYQISYAREWETGLAKKRIDGLMKLIPELKDTGTIHIDAFHSTAIFLKTRGQPNRDYSVISPYLGYSCEQEAAAQRKTFRYFREDGMDVTSEFNTELRVDPLIGLQPMAASFKPMKDIPSALYCGTTLHPGCQIKHKNHPVNFQRIFCLTTAPWIWNNFIHNPGNHGLYASVDAKLKVVAGGDCCGPLPWKKEPTVVAYSQAGCQNKIWNLPTTWKSVKSARVFNVTPGMVAEIERIAVKDGQLTISLKPGQEIMIAAEAGSQP